MINIPTVELAKKVVGCGNTSGRKVDKFKTFGLTPVPASCVKAPLIDECYANLECKVVDTKLVAQIQLLHPRSGQGVDRSFKETAADDSSSGEGAFMVAGKTIKLPSKMK